MRNRLIELIVDAENEIFHEKPFFTDTERIMKVADHLLANGIIAPPCKVGQTVYYPYYNRVLGVPDEMIVETMKVRKYKDSNFVFECKCGFIFLDTDLGKTVFLTRDDAEKALAERSENGT